MTGTSANESSTFVFGPGWLILPSRALAAEVKSMRAVCTSSIAVSCGPLAASLTLHWLSALFRRRPWLLLLCLVLLFIRCSEHEFRRNLLLTLLRVGIEWTERDALNRLRA